MKRGFVDIQINGWQGIDFSQPGLTVEAVRTVTNELVARGTRAYCPTMVTSADAVYRENLAVLAQAMHEPDLAPHLLGIHLEGPFISSERGARGAHQPEFVQEPSWDAFCRFQEWADGKVVILTVAPERPNAAELISRVSASGVVVALGHHLGSSDEINRAVEAGASCCTHLGNGLPNEINRHVNPLWAQLASDGLWASCITDGHHLPKEFVTVALRAKTPARFVVTSDAAPLAGMPPGEYPGFGKTVVIEEGGRIFCEESGSLAGSHATMLECMNILAEWRLLTEDDLWRVSMENPLALLKKSPAYLHDVPGPEVSYRDGRFVLVP